MPEPSPVAPYVHVRKKADAAPAPTAVASWPAELHELISLPPFAECLAALGVASLQDFLETFDDEKGHDVMLREALAGLPDKPKKNRIIKARSTNALNDLLARLAIFEDADEDDDGVLSFQEASARLPHDCVVPKTGLGDTLAQAFDAMDTDQSGRLSLFEFVEGFKLVVGDGSGLGAVPASPAPLPQGADASVSAALPTTAP